MARKEIKYLNDDEIKDLGGKVQSAAVKALKKQQNKIGNEYGNKLDQLDRIEKEADWIKDKFVSFCEPHPREFNDKLDALDDIAGKLGTGEDVFGDGDLEMIDTAKGWMDEWEGALANSFVANYLTPLPTIAQNQGRLHLVLWETLKAMSDIYAQARRSLKDIGENAITAFDKVDDIPTNDLKALLTVVSTAFGVGSVALGKTPFAAKASIASAVVAGGIAIGGNEIDDTEHPLAADFADEVLENLEDAIKQLEKDIKKKEDELIEVIAEATREVKMLSILQQMDDYFSMHIDQPMKGSVLVPGIPEMAVTAAEDHTKLDDGIFQSDK